MSRLIIRFATGSAIIALAAPAFAQIAGPPTPDASAPVELAALDAADGGTIVVTGSRSQSRTVADSPVPIDVLSREQIEATGRTGLKEILGNLVPSLTMPALGGGGTSASVKPIAIRGLSGDYLLVLVNGKRRHTTSLINNLSRISGGSTPVDIDLLPTNSVGRIEVLRDGAAAQYGSDAISGVINIILDNRPDGGDFTTTVGRTFSKGAELVQSTLGYGVPLANDGFIRFAIEGRYRDRAESSASPVAQIYPRLVDGSPDPREATVEHVIAGGYGRSNRDYVLNSSYNAELPVGEALTLYSFSTFSIRRIKDARGAFPANHVASLPQLYPNGFQAYRRIRENDFQATVGGKGDLGKWHWDLSSSYGRDHVWLGAENTLNPSLGPSSPTRFFMGKQIQDLWVSNLDVGRSFDIGLAEPLALSFGIEHRWEKFQNRAGEPDSYRDGGYVIPRDGTPFGLAFGGQSPSPGLVSFTGTSPADAVSLSRNNVAGYIDLSTNITPEWFVGLAGRAEHYDDSSGETVSGKFSTRYELTPTLAVRGGVNTGFRAPSLAQQGFSTTQNTVTVIGNERVSTTSKFLPVNSLAAQALGAKPLKPEKSLNFSAGLAFEPTSAFRLTIDAYQIEIDDRIAKTEFLGTSSNGGAAIRAILNANGVTGVDSAQYFANAIDTRTRGVDVVGEYTLKSDSAGTLRLSAAYSYNKTKITKVADNPAALSSLNVVLFGRQAQTDLVRATPRDKLVLNGDWSVGPVHANLRLTRYGKYTEASNVAANDRVFSARWVTDINLGYDLSENVTLSAGADNLFDVYPEKNGLVAFEGSGRYGNFAPFGLSGGFYYGRVAVRF